MLANLDNEVHFKKVFTDIEVFCAFVKDVLGIDMDITKVETEKVLQNKVSAIKFRMDLFAEDKKNRTVVEIQKVDYDYTYDRFTHYFLGNLIDMQRSSRNYVFAKEVYIIVVVTAAYRVSDKTGKLIKDDVLITDINPRTLQGEVRDMYNHKMVVLNTTNSNEATPEAIKDWLDLIIQSIQNPENPIINTSKPAIVKAAHLAEIDEIDPEQLHEAKIQEMRKEVTALNEAEALAKGEAKGFAKGEAIGLAEGEAKVRKENTINLLKLNILSIENIAIAVGASVEYVKAIEQEIKNG